MQEGWGMPDDYREFQDRIFLEIEEKEQSSAAFEREVEKTERLANERGWDESFLRTGAEAFLECAKRPTKQVPVERWKRMAAVFNAVADRMRETTR
jgi:hypothetical protein